MADLDQEQNRSEPATPFKLKEARERGVVAKSVELNSVLITFAFVALLYAAGRQLFERQLRLDAAILSQAGELRFTESAAMAWLSSLAIDTIGLLVPLFALLVLVGIAGTLLQAGPVFSFKPLKPDFDRVNPASGLKRLLSLRLAFEACKSVVKLGLLGYALFALLDELMPIALALVQTDVAAYPRVGLDAVASLLFKLALVMLAIALLDTAYVRWDYARRMRMSRRELREELKRREGDPKIRARMRELQREMRKRTKALRRVPEADVLITNPRHLAVALVYRPEEMSAPRLIAKGAGELAERMKAVARRHGIPLVENRPLARALFLRTELESAIPAAQYPTVARVLAWVYALREFKRGAR